MGGFVGKRGKWDHKNAPTNRNLFHHNEVMDAIMDAFRWLDKRQKSKERLFGEPQKNKVKALNKAGFNKNKILKTTYTKNRTFEVASHNVIRSVDDVIPELKLTGNTRVLFKGKSFRYMAKEYPYIFIKFLSERKELSFPDHVVSLLIEIAKKEIQIRSRN